MNDLDWEAEHVRFHKEKRKKEKKKKEKDKCKRKG